MSDEPTYIVNYAPNIYDVFISDGGARDYTDREVVKHDASNIAHNFIRGNMYAYEVARVITVTLANTWYEITGDMTGGVEYGCTFQNAHEILLPTAGDYIVTWSMGITSGTNDEIMGTVGVDNIPQTKAANHSTVAATGRYVSVSGTTILTVTAGQVISLFVLNESAAANITLEHATLSVLRTGP